VLPSTDIRGTGPPVRRPCPGPPVSVSRHPDNSCTDVPGGHAASVLLVTLAVVVTVATTWTVGRRAVLALPLQVVLPRPDGQG
jgi:hypothetical protein